MDDLPQNKKEPRCGHPSCGTRHDPPFFFLHRAASRRLSDPPDKESSLLRAGELFRMLLVLPTNEGERERERERVSERNDIGLCADLVRKHRYRVSWNDDVTM